MAKHGKKASFKLDTLANVLTDISRKLTSISSNFDVDLEDVTAFQATGDAKEYLVGYNDGKISIEGNADAAIATHMMAIRGKSEVTGGVVDEGFDFELAPDGTTSGSRRFTGKCLLAKYSETTPTGVNKFSAEFQCVGAITVGTFA